MLKNLLKSRMLDFFIFFVPLSAEQPHAPPIFPNNINNVSRRPASEIKHTVMTSVNKARFDLCAASARTASFFVTFLFCFSGLISTEFALSSSKDGLMKDPWVDERIVCLLNIFKNGSSVQIIIYAPPLLSISNSHVCTLSQTYVLKNHILYSARYPYNLFMSPGAIT